MRGRETRARWVVRLRAWALAGGSVLAGLAATPALAQPSPAQPQASPAPQPAVPAIDVTLPLVLDGVYIGDIGARTTINGTLVSIGGRRFLELLGPRLNDEARAALASRIAAAGDFLPLTEAQLPGLSVSFDAANFAVSASVATTAARALRWLSRAPARRSMVWPS